MKYAFATIAVLGLSACMGGGGSTGGSAGGGGGGGDIDLTQDTPRPSLNNGMGELMNGVRAGGGSGLFPLEYNADVGQAAQDHVDDMLANDYTGTTIDVGLPTARDGADTARQVYFVDWQDFIQMIARGGGANNDGSLQSIFDQWTTTGSNGDPGPQSGSTAIAFNAALTDDAWDIFGLARAGQGDDARWMLILLDQP